MTQSISRWCSAALRFLARWEDVAPLIVRLVFGYFWFETGLAKVQNLDGFTQRFVDWGIPFPAFNAGLSAWTELIGGALIFLGLFTRLTAIPMIINMIVAIALVVHGPALKAFHTASASPDTARRTEQFSKAGLQLSACGNTMRAQDITLKDLLPGFVAADRGGVVRIAELQAQGYVYLRP